ncbi:MAG: hypothetical protein NFW16_18515, partial [Candidatus Accumulibacter sp.]|uniref:hypothetical protein n=1 Tax=Accumulibacter sp. TaxID=2053492 RepID=UPI002585B4D1
MRPLELVGSADADQAEAAVAVEVDDVVGTGARLQFAPQGVEGRRAQNLDRRRQIFLVDELDQRTRDAAVGDVARLAACRTWRLGNRQILLFG